MNKYTYKFLGYANDAIGRLEYKIGVNKPISLPVTVDVVLTKACNFACQFCKDYETPDGAPRISLENFSKMGAQLFPTARRLNICSGGEPYLHNGLVDILRFGKQYALYTWVLSNGSVLNMRRLETILNEELIDEHGFSVDGFKDETVESIRVNANLSKVLGNIEAVIRKRDELRKKHPTITIRYALMRRNIEEIVDAVRRWGDLGINRIDCGYLSLANGMDRNESLFYHPEITARMFDAARKAAETYPKMRLNLPELIENQKQQRVAEDCESPWRFVMIDTNGQVLPCYNAFEALRFPTIYGENGANFRDIWTSENYQSLRRTVNNDAGEKYYPYCEKCEVRCGWGEEKTHLGDETWLDIVKDWLPDKVNHKRPEKGTAASV